MIYSGVSQNGHPEKRTTPLQRTDLVARIELRSVLLMDKQSPRSGHLSTTDKSPVPDVSVIRRLHCSSSSKMSAGVRPAGRMWYTDLSLRDIGLNFIVKMRTYM